MNRIATERPPYRSALREEQATQTRERILDALVRVMARGLAELSMPAVAREAGVSVPTVYRHFGSKAALLGALQPHFAARIGMDRMTIPGSPDELEDTLRTVFGRIDAMDGLAHAALMSPLGEQARRLQMSARQQAIAAVVDAVAADLPPATRARLARLLLVLTTTSSLRTLRAHLGLSTDEAAGEVAWVFRAAIAGATSVDSR